MVHLYERGTGGAVYAAGCLACCCQLLTIHLFLFVIFLECPAVTSSSYIIADSHKLGNDLRRLLNRGNVFLVGSSSSTRKARDSLRGPLSYKFFGPLSSHARLQWEEWPNIV